MKYFALHILDAKNLPQTGAGSDTVNKGFSIFYEIIGAVALMLLVIAALRYMAAGSDSARVAESKRMIAYTLVGLAVVTLASAIVEFVLKVQP